MIEITSGKRRVRPVIPIPLLLVLLIAIPAGGDTLSVVGRLALPYCTNVTVRDHICYVTDAYGLEAVDVSNPANPVLLGRCPLPDTAQAVTLRDSIAYVSDAEEGLAIINVARPESLKLLSRWRQYPGYAHEAVVVQDTVFIAYGESQDTTRRGGLMVLDISNPRSPAFSRYYTSAFYEPWPPYRFRGVNYTSVTHDSGKYFIAASIFMGDYIGAMSWGGIEPYSTTYDWGGGGLLAVRKMYLKLPYAIITFPRTRLYNLAILRLRSTGSVDSLFEYNIGGNGRGIWREQDKVYVALDSTIRLLDVSDISSPLMLAACSLDNITNGLQAIEPYIYVANGPYLTILQHSPSGAEERGQEVKQLNHQGLRILPNPFQKHCTISFGQAYAGKACLSIYNAMGRKIRSFVVSSRTMREIPWDGKDEKRNDLPGGVFFLRFEHGAGCETRKAVLLR